MDAESVYSKAWTHFEMIAKQRISTFNFYLIILGALLTAFYSFDPEKHNDKTFFLMAICNVIAPLAFFAIDHRLQRLLGNLKSILFDVETWPEWHSDFRPFHKDQDIQSKWWAKLSSYTFVFTVVFVLHFIFGTLLFLPSFWGVDNHKLSKGQIEWKVEWQSTNTK